MVPSKAKELLRGLYDLCDTIQDTPIFQKICQKANTDLSMRQLLYLDICQFLMYLSASDGHVNQVEAAYISEILDGQLSVNQITSIIEKNNIYSTAFENEVPMSLRIFIMMDNAIFDANQSIDKNSSEILLEYFQALGQHFINCDNSIDTNERSDLSIYINTMKTYLSKELKSLNAGPTIVKNTSTSNTLKAKYEAIKKK